MGDPGSCLLLYRLICILRATLPGLQRGYLGLSFSHGDHKWQQLQRASKPGPLDACVWFSAIHQPHEGHQLCALTGRSLWWDVPQTASGTEDRPF